MPVDSERPIPVTSEGLRKAQAELEALRARRVEIAQRIRAAKEFGDLTENAEYDDAKNAQGFIEGRILELEKIVRNAHVIEKPRHDGLVGMGSTVVVEEDGSRDSYTIVGTSEVEVPRGRISHQSPIGKALMGHRAGEEVTIETPNGPRRLRIVEVQ